MRTFLSDFFAKSLLVFFSFFILTSKLVQGHGQGCTTPRVFDVTGNGCTDGPINLNGSETGVFYHLMTYDGISNVQVAELQGSGLALSFNPPFDAGRSYFVIATNDCSPAGGVSMNGVITMGFHPQVFDVSGGCIDKPINLSGSQVGAKYFLMTYNGLSNIQVAELQGTGSGLSFEPPFNAGNYFIVAKSNDCTPSVLMNGTVIVGPYPQVFVVTGGCPDMPITLSGSQLGVTYHLWTMNMLTAEGVHVAQLQGTGGQLSFDPPFDLGRPYFVIANNACSPIQGVNMNGTVIMGPYPQVFDVTGGCPDMPINLSGSQVGVTYHLWTMNMLTAEGVHVAQLQGTGEPLSFNPPFNVGGRYFVIANNACSPFQGVNMNGTVLVGLQTFFHDADGDGYGDQAAGTQACSAPPGYVTNSTDCNDSKATIHPGATENCDELDNDCDGEIDEGVKTTFYKDQDGDGYGDLSVTTETCSVPEGYVANNTDCDDNNGSAHESFVFYIDGDGDGYGNVWAKGRELCAVDANTPPYGFSANNSDCDDEDPSIWRSALLYIDQDDDGYDNGQEEKCYGENAPTGYLLTTNGPDCDDSKASMHESFAFYRDQDGDGYGSIWAKGQEFCVVDANTPPEGFSANNSDCDDEDPNIWRSDLLYIDQDDDGYDYGQEEKCYGENAPTGYSLTTNGPDCDDSKASMHESFAFYRDQDGDGYGSIWAKGQEFCVVDANTPPEGFSANNSDCDDEDPNIWRSDLLYIDQDDDGYDYGQEEKCYGENAPTGYSLTTNGPDCDDSKASMHASFAFYIDQDGDGYGSIWAIGQEFCAVDANTPPAGFSANHTDCNDNNAAIHPGATEVCNGIDDNCNGVIDEQACTCQNASNLSTINITCNSATLNWTSYIDPTLWEVEYKSTANGGKWIRVPVPNAPARSVTITGLKPNQNYNWHIRAKCGKAWTAYSVSVAFKTLAKCTSAADQSKSMNETKPESEISELSETLKVVAMPNPSNTSFRITINSKNVKDPVKLFVTDILGRVIETRTTNAGQIITIGEKYINGTYSVRLIQGNKIKQLKLVKLQD